MFQASKNMQGILKMFVSMRIIRKKKWRAWTQSRKRNNNTGQEKNNDKKASRKSQLSKSHVSYSKIPSENAQAYFCSYFFWNFVQSGFIC